MEINMGGHGDQLERKATCLERGTRTVAVVVAGCMYGLLVTRVLQHRAVVMVVVVVAVPAVVLPVVVSV
jgi:hypothetical protein